MKTKKKTKTVSRSRALAARAKKWILMPSGSDLAVHLAILGLAVFGTIMVGSATMGIKTGNSVYLAFTVAKQIIFAIAGYAMMTRVANGFTLGWLRKLFPGIVFLTWGVLLACLLFIPTGNAHAWLRFGFAGLEVTLQPSEFAKIVAFLTVAAYCGDVKKKYGSWWEMCQTPVFFTGVMVFIVLVIQSDFGSALVIFLITCVCFLIPQHENMSDFQKVLKILFWIVVAFSIYLLSPAGTHMIEGFSFLDDYQKERFFSAMNPFADPYGNSYQLINGLISFATGSWFGTGYGTSVRKYTSFPAANTDYILAIVVEELGYAGFIFLMFLYCVILFRLFRHAFRIKSERAKIILIGTAMYLLIHMFFNIGGVTGLVPLTGIPLLMISAGGSSTMSFMVAVGLCQAVISGYDRKEAKK